MPLPPWLLAAADPCSGLLPTRSLLTRSLIHVPLPCCSTSARARLRMRCCLAAAGSRAATSNAAAACLAPAGNECPTHQTVHALLTVAPPHLSLPRYLSRFDTVPTPLLSCTPCVTPALGATTYWLQADAGSSRCPVTVSTAVIDRKCMKLVQHQLANCQRWLRVIAHLRHAALCTLCCARSALQQHLAAAGVHLGGLGSGHHLV